MASKHFRVVARVNSSNPKAVLAVLEQVIKKASVKEAKGEYTFEADMEGETAKDLNRTLLSALRRAEKRTRLHSEWTADDGTTQRFFDYVLKKTSKAGQTS